MVKKENGKKKADMATMLLAMTRMTNGKKKVEMATMLLAMTRMTMTRMTMMRMTSLENIPVKMKNMIKGMMNGFALIIHTQKKDKLN